VSVQYNTAVSANFDYEIAKGWKEDVTARYFHRCTAIVEDIVAIKKN
jgi:hypothetical protein